MRSNNEKGQVVIFFVLLIPLFVLLMVMSVEFSRVVLTKIKLQQTADKAIFAGASYLTEALNQTALSNQKVHQKFLHLKQWFKEGSKKSHSDAKIEIAKTLAEQNTILDEEMTPNLEEAYQKAYAIADQIVQKNFPEARFVPLYSLPVRIGEGKTQDLGFDQIKGVVFDPNGHQDIAGDGFTARVAFRKNDQDQVALAGGLEFQSLRAVAAAQPNQGSIWDYALSGKEERLYQTTMVPLKTLSPAGYKKWEDFNPYAVEH